MHAARPLAVLALTALTALPAFAQQLELPRPSPNAKVSQWVGVTEITVDYSSPGVRGRKVFPDVAPYGKVWRAGANAATKITFSKDVQVGGTKVPAGTYSFFAIPGQEQWTLILNKNANANTDQYKESEDVARATVKAERIPARERLAYLFADSTDSATNLQLEWAESRATLPIQAFTDAQMKASIGQLETGGWRPYTQAARYLLEAKKDPETALRLIDKSIALHEEWLNVWTKAELLHAAGNKAEAHKLAERAQTLGQAKPDQFFFAADVKKAVNDWK